MVSQLEMLMEQDDGLVIPGDAPSFGSAYSDMGLANQAAADWTTIITAGLGKVVDMELMKRYSPGQNQTPNAESGRPAGTTGAISINTMAPWLIGGGVLLALFMVLRK